MCHPTRTESGLIRKEWTIFTFENDWICNAIHHFSLPVRYLNGCVSTRVYFPWCFVRHWDVCSQNDRRDCVELHAHLASKLALISFTLSLVLSVCFSLEKKACTKAMKHKANIGSERVFAGSSLLSFLSMRSGKNRPFIWMMQQQQPPFELHEVEKHYRKSTRSSRLNE